MTINADDIERMVSDCIKREYSDPYLTLEQVAKEIGYSSRTIQRCLAACETNWPSMLMTERVQQAHKLLISSDLGIDEIAEAVGYKTPTTLRIHYKQKYGTSASKTRQEARSRGAR
jgi:transcriptional regulator GlxA family with amidase domain